LRARSRMSRKLRTRSDSVGGDFRLGGFIVLELAEAGVGPGGGLEHLFLLEHLGGVLESFVLQQPLHQFAARVFSRIIGSGGGTRQQHLALDVNQQRAV